jgi:hypothetical protein
MNSNPKMTLIVAGFALAMGAQTALAEGVGTGSPDQANGVTTNSLTIDAPTRYRPMEGVGTGSPNSNPTSTSYHFSRSVGVHRMEGVGTGSPDAVVTTSCVAPASLWTALACSILQ